MGFFASNLSSNRGMYCGLDTEEVEGKASRVAGGIIRDSKYSRLDKLARYLRQRVQAFSLSPFNLNNIQDRTNFIQKLKDNLENEQKLNELLEEKNIIRFKGVFTHKMYDLLVELRDGVKVHDMKRFDTRPIPRP